MTTTKKVTALPTKKVTAKEEATLPTIAGVELPVDEHGRIHLNALHRASGTLDNKQPNRWVRTKTAQGLIEELSAQTLDMAYGEGVLHNPSGGNNPGVWANVLLAISYAGWISHKFQLQVNQAYLDYKTGKLQEVNDQLQLTNDKLELVNITLTLQLEAQQPRVDFANAVEKSPDQMLIRDEAKVISVPRVSYTSSCIS